MTIQFVSSVGMVSHPSDFNQIWSAFGYENKNYTIKCALPLLKIDKNNLFLFDGDLLFDTAPHPLEVSSLKHSLLPKS